MSSEVIPSYEPGVDRRGNLSAALLNWLNAVSTRFPSASKGVLSIFDQAIVSGTGFLTAAIIGRMTSPDDLGLYYLVLTIVLIISGAQDQLVASPYAIYSKRRSGSELRQYTGSAWMHNVILTVAAVVGLLIAIGVCSVLGYTSIRPGLWALVGAGPLMMLRDTIRRFAYADLRLTSVIPIDAVVAVVQLGGLALLGYFGLLSIFNIYAMMGTACGVACLGWYLLDPPRVQFVRKRFAEDWQHNWAFGKWALRTFLVGNTTPYINLWILSFAAGTAAAGVLGGCTTLAGMTNVILTGVSNILTPHAAQAYVIGGATNLRRVLWRAAAFLLLVLGGFCVFVLLSGDWLPVLVFGQSFEGTGTIVFLLALNMLMVSMGMVAGNGLWALDRPQLNFVADVSCMLTTLVAAALLIAPLGALGAALATLIGTAVACVVRTFTLIRHLDARIMET